MKKIFLFAFVFLAAVIFGHAQVPTVVVKGQVTNSVSNVPMSNHPVLIVSDSSVSGFAYVATVLTNNAGYYFKSIQIPLNQLLIFTISTVDCNGTLHSVTDTVTGYHFIHNFSLCAAPPPPPVCQAGFNPSTVNLPPLHVKFVNTSTGYPAQYSWDFGDGTTSTVISPMHLYTQAGTYTVCLVMTAASGCTDTSCQTVVVQGTPPPPPPLCCHAKFGWQKQGLTVTFHGHAMGAQGPYTYAWDFGDGGTSSLKDPVYTYSAAGTYTVVLTATSLDSCVASRTRIVTVIAPDPGPFDLHGRVFAGFQQPMTDGWVTLYTPDPAANVLIALDSIVVDTMGYYEFLQLAPGTYFLRAYPTPGSLVDSLFKPTYFPHNSFPAFMSAIILPPLHNPYNIKLRPKNIFCSKEEPTDVKFFGLDTDADDADGCMISQIFPNPASDVLNLEISTKESMNAEMSVFNFLGQKLIHRQFELIAGTQLIRVDAVPLPQGMYTIVIQTSSGIQAKEKILIAR